MRLALKFCGVSSYVRYAQGVNSSSVVFVVQYVLLPYAALGKWGSNQLCTLCR